MRRACKSLCFLALAWLTPAGVRADPVSWAFPPPAAGGAAVSWQFSRAKPPGCPCDVCVCPDCKCGFKARLRQKLAALRKRRLARQGCAVRGAGCLCGCLAGGHCSCAAPRFAFRPAPVAFMPPMPMPFMGGGFGGGPPMMGGFGGGGGSFGGGGGACGGGG